MTASVIIPNHRSEATLPRTLASVRAAAKGLDVEVLVCDDPEGKGLSWARNCGLKRARGEAVFFVDADDTVQPAFFRRHLEVLAATGADFVLSSFRLGPLKRDYTLTGNAEIRRVLLPAFFGYDFDDIRRWNAGGELTARREQGGVWRTAFRREFLERHGLKFDERLRLFEDSPFIAEAALYAEQVASFDEVLYDYVPGPQGILATSLGGERYWQYKFDALANRRAIDARAGGGVLEHFAASAALSALELLRARRGVRRYLADAFVRRAVAEFPCSWRHPLVAAGMGILRGLCR